MICWKIRIFAYWTTPVLGDNPSLILLWFAEKFVSLLIEQHRYNAQKGCCISCDLLKNSYLCLLNNTHKRRQVREDWVVICWKIRIFAYWTTPHFHCFKLFFWLWFAEKFVSLLIEQHRTPRSIHIPRVVICWKIRIFAYWTTPSRTGRKVDVQLWFAEKFVSLLIEQHPLTFGNSHRISCDLLKNSYLCLLNNT